MNLVGDVWSQITFVNFFVNLIFAGMIALLLRVVVGVFKLAVQRELLYWSSVPPH